MEQFHKFSNKEELLKYMEVMNRFQKGEIAYLTEEDAYLMYDGEQWLEIGTDLEVNNEGAQMTLYDLNKMYFSQLTPKETETELKECEETFNKYHNLVESDRYMLLCKEISYYTIFELNDVADFEEFGAGVMECLENVGKILSVDILENEQVAEVWIRLDDDQNVCMYLFNAKEFIVKFRR